METAFLQQMVVFAAIFLICQVGFAWMRDQPVTPGSFGWMILTTIVATVVYGALNTWLQNRKNRGD